MATKKARYSFQALNWKNKFEYFSGKFSTLKEALTWYELYGHEFAKERLLVLCHKGVPIRNKHNPAQQKILYRMREHLGNADMVNNYAASRRALREHKVEEYLECCYYGILNYQKFYKALL